MNDSTQSLSAPTCAMLPAIPALGGQVEPVVVIDTRERTPLMFRRLKSVRGTLQAGDYSVRGAEDLFAVERKSIADLVGCSTGAERRRFDRQLHRLGAYRFRRLIIVGHRIEVEQRRYRSNLSPKAILGTLAAFEVRHDVPVSWSDTPDEAAAIVERWAWWFARELVNQAAKLQAVLGAARTPEVGP